MDHKRKTGNRPHARGHLIFNKGADVIQWGKENLQVMLLEQLRIDMGKT